MAKRTWIDRIVQFPRRFKDQNGNTLTLTPDPGIITQAGTPVNAAMLNGLENDVQAIADSQQIKHYVTLGQAGLTDSQFSATDFAANMLSLFTTVNYHAMVYLYTSATNCPNLNNSIIAYLTSLGYPVTTEYAMRVISTGSTAIPNEIIIRPNNGEFLFVATYDNSLRGFTDITGKANSSMKLTLNSVTKDILRAIGNTPTSNGVGISIGAGGAVVVGAGESHDAITASAVLTGGEETLYLGADNNIEFYTGANSGIASAKNFGLDTTALITTEKKFINKAINELASGNTTIVLYNGIRQYLKADDDGIYLVEV
jgi:hypothetical protein